MLRGRVIVTKRQILDLWMYEHGSLSPQRQEEFLARSELTYLDTHTLEEVTSCIRKHKKLEDIATCLRNRQPDTNSMPNPEPRASTPKSSQTGTGQRPQPRTGRSRTEGEVWDRPVPYGTTDPRYK